MDDAIGKDINDKDIFVGDTVELLFPFTKTKCKVKVLDRGIFPDSEFQTIYGDWFKKCKKV